MSVTLKSRLPQISAELRPRVRAAVVLGAEAIAQAAKERVPVKTGELRDAIHVDHEGAGPVHVVAGNSQAFYGHMVEFGTAHSAAHPFLVPAAEARKGAVEAAVVAALRHI